MDTCGDYNEHIIQLKDQLNVILFLFSVLTLEALPPPPVSEEEGPANYFNLGPSSAPTVMNMGLPPPPGVTMPPPPGRTPSA